MRFVHLADLHLDTPFVGRSDSLRRRLREATREAFRRGLRHAIDAQVDAVLLAGDLLDGATVTLSTEHFLLDEVRRLTDAGIPLFYITGNHDPGVPGSLAQRLPWPDGVHVFPDDQVRTVPVLRDGRLVGTVTGVGHATSQEGRDLSVTLHPPAGRSVPAVALLHTQVVGAGSADDHDRYAPSTLSHLRKAGFDYWALGHIHLPQCLEQVPGIHYPGNPQGRSPRETGPRGGLLVELPAPNDAPIVRQLELGTIRWEVMELPNLESLEDAHALIQTIQQKWKEARAGDPGLPGAEWILRLQLQGRSPLAGRLAEPGAREDLEEMLRDTLGLLHAEVRTDGLLPDLDVSSFWTRQDAVGEVFRLLNTLMHDDLAPGELARALGLSSSDLAGLDAHDPAGIDAYLRAMLKDADGELARRFDRGGVEP